MTLLGTVMDYVDGKLASEFVFENPNVTGFCGCGESFSLNKDSLPSFKKVEKQSWWLIQPYTLVLDIKANI